MVFTLRKREWVTVDEPIKPIVLTPKAQGFLFYEPGSSTYQTESSAFLELPNGWFALLATDAHGALPYAGDEPIIIPHGAQTGIPGSQQVLKWMFASLYDLLMSNYDYWCHQTDEKYIKDQIRLLDTILGRSLSTSRILTNDGKEVSLYNTGAFRPGVCFALALIPPNLSKVRLIRVGDVVAVVNSEDRLEPFVQGGETAQHDELASSIFGAILKMVEATQALGHIPVGNLSENLTDVLKEICDHVFGWWFDLDGPNAAFRKDYFHLESKETLYQQLSKKIFEGLPHCKGQHPVKATWKLAHDPILLLRDLHVNGNPEIPCTFPDLTGQCFTGGQYPINNNLLEMMTFDEIPLRGASEIRLFSDGRFGEKAGKNEWVQSLQWSGCTNGDQEEQNHIPGGRAEMCGVTLSISP